MFNEETNPENESIDPTVISFVVDYAKRKSDTGYEVIIYELQALTQSELAFEVNGNYSKEYKALFGTQVVRVGNPILQKANYPDQENFSSYDGFIESLTLEQKGQYGDLIDKLSGWYIDIDLSPQKKGRHVDTQDARKLLVINKAVQRLYFSTQPDIKNMMPDKSLIATTGDFKKADYLHKLRQYFKSHNHVVLKLDSGTKGKGNLFIDLSRSDEEVCAEIEKHLKKNGFSDRMSVVIESVSTLSHSKDKSHSSNYRLGLYKTSEDFNAINLYKHHTPGTNTDSHASDGTYLFTQGYQKSSVSEDRITLNKDSINRNIYLKDENKILLKQFKLLADVVFNANKQDIIHTIENSDLMSDSNANCSFMSDEAKEVTIETCKYFLQIVITEEPIKEPPKNKSNEFEKKSVIQALRFLQKNNLLNKEDFRLLAEGADVSFRLASSINSSSFQEIITSNMSDEVKENFLTFVINVSQKELSTEKLEACINLALQAYQMINENKKRVSAEHFSFWRQGHKRNIEFEQRLKTSIRLLSLGDTDNFILEIKQLADSMDKYNTDLSNELPEIEMLYGFTTDPNYLSLTDSSSDKPDNMPKR